VLAATGSTTTGPWLALLGAGALVPTIGYTTAGPGFVLLTAGTLTDPPGPPTVPADAAAGTMIAAAVPMTPIVASFAPADAGTATKPAIVGDGSRCRPASLRCCGARRVAPLAAAAELLFFLLT
jgi:hypothetical protein